MAIGAGKSLSLAQKLAQAQARANPASTSTAPPPPPPPQPRQVSLEDKIKRLAEDHPLRRPLLSIQQHYQNKGKDIDKNFVLQPPTSVLEGEYDARTSTVFFAFWRPNFRDGSQACQIRLDFGKSAALDEIADNADRYSTRLEASVEDIRQIARKLSTGIASRLVAAKIRWEAGYCSSEYEYSRWICKLAHPGNDLKSQANGIVDFLENCYSGQREGRPSTLQKTVQSIKTILGEDSHWSQPPADLDLRLLFSRVDVYRTLLNRLPVLQKDDATIESNSQIVVPRKRTAGEVSNKKKGDGKKTLVSPPKSVLAALRDFPASQWTKLLSSLSRPLRSFIRSNQSFATIDFEGNCKKRFSENSLPVFYVTTFVTGPLPGGGHALGQRLGPLDGDSEIEWSFLELDRNGKKVRETHIEGGDSMILVRAIQIATANFTLPLVHFSFSNFENKVIESSFYVNGCLGTVAKPVTSPPSSDHYQKMAGTQSYPVHVDGKDYTLIQFNFAGIASKLHNRAGIPKGVAKLSMFRDSIPGQDGRTIVEGVDSKRAVKPVFSKYILDQPEWARTKAKKASADISDETTFVNDLRSIDVLKQQESHENRLVPFLPAHKRPKPNSSAPASLSITPSTSASSSLPSKTPSSSSTSTAAPISSNSSRPGTLLNFFTPLPKKVAEEEKEKNGGKGKNERNEGSRKKKEKEIECLEIDDSEEEGDGETKRGAEVEGEGEGEGEGEAKEDIELEGEGKGKVEELVIDDSDDEEEDKVRDEGRVKEKGKGKESITIDDSDDEEMEVVETVKSGSGTDEVGIDREGKSSEGKEIGVEESELDLEKDNVEEGAAEEDEQEEELDVDSLGDEFWKALQARVDQLVIKGYSKTASSSKK